MDDDERTGRAASFGSVVDSYATARPGYPDEAVRWLVGERPATVLELGAGTGKLTATLVALGHQVYASEPDPAMLARLRADVPQAHALQARAEDIPLPSSSVDVVVAAQSFHWFDQDHAMPEIARVLRPGGALALMWNNGDHRVPWVAKVMAFVDLPRTNYAELDPFVDSEIFVLTEHTTFKHSQMYVRDTLVEFVASSSRAATASAADRAALLDEVGALYDSYGRGPDGLHMPWLSQCYRARVAGLEAPDESALSGSPPADADDTVVISFT